MFPEDDNYYEIALTRNKPEPITPAKKRVHSKKFLAKKKDFRIPNKIHSDPIDWQARIEKLENYFANISLPQNSIALNPCTTIIDVPGFVESHLTYIKNCQRSSVHLPYLERLEKLMEILESTPLSLDSDYFL